MVSWYWNDRILRCTLLDAWPHGFFTRNHAPALPQELQTVFYGAGQAFHATQVHGAICLKAQTALATPPQADALWALPDTQPQSVWVCSADCVPALLADPQTGAVAAVHAGWRGTVAQILQGAITALLHQGASVSQLRVALGPAIAGESYQVGIDVADRVKATLKVPVGITPDPEPGRCRLDLRQVQYQQLLELGLEPQHIAIAPYCTLQSPDLFFSYRRHTLLGGTGSAGVQWSGIATRSC